MVRALDGVGRGGAGEGDINWRQGKTDRARVRATHVSQMMYVDIEEFQINQYNTMNENT